MHFRYCLLIASMLTITGLLGGCQRSLFPSRMERTPYARYQALRGQERTAATTNEFGDERPDLRDRLRPLGEP